VKQTARRPGTKNGAGTDGFPNATIDLPEIRACFGAFVWRACGEIAREDSLLEITLFQTVGTLKRTGKVNKSGADSFYN
jgi:hypothetical protein